MKMCCGYSKTLKKMACISKMLSFAASAVSVATVVLTAYTMCCAIKSVCAKAK